MFLTLVLTGLGIVPWDLTGFLVRNRLFNIELSYVYLLYMYVTYMNL